MHILKRAYDRQPNLIRWASHIRQRLLGRRLSLLTGAGLSMEAGAPSWKGLIEDLANNLPDFKDTFERHKISDIPDTIKTEFIFERYMKRELPNVADLPSRIGKKIVNIGWHSIVRQAIYRNVSSNIEEILSKHTYLRALSELCNLCDSSITFNFDDILDSACQAINGTSDAPPKTTWRTPSIESLNNSYILHINGLLPQSPGMKTSESLVFTENSFLETSHNERDRSFIFNKFVNNTFLLVGLSLTDYSLKANLSRLKRESPGSFHYVIHWIKDEKSLDQNQMDDITNANFKLYNLVTIFLTSEEINAFIRFVLVGIKTRSDFSKQEHVEEFRDAAESIQRGSPISFKYYVAGAVGAGKSTLLENLRSFYTLEEWPQPAPKTMYQDFSTLDKDELDKIDVFVYRQLRIKNNSFREPSVGIRIMDRAPLDLFAFTSNDSFAEENKRKASDLRTNVEREATLADGVVILVDADGATLIDRQLNRGRIPKDREGGFAYDRQGLDRQREILKMVYPNSFVVDNDHCSKQELVSGVVDLIVFGKYEPTKISDAIKAFE
jgi:hypothetical protein